jgi:hypothetical protein
MDIIDKSATRDAWYCTGPCQQLMFNKKLIDGAHYPVAGAPQAYYISVVFPRVCSLCFEMYKLIEDKSYWKEIQAEFAEKQRRVRKLKSGEDYLSA